MENAHGRRMAIFGCGYVGGEVARQAISRGWEVTALTRNARDRGFKAVTTQPPP